MSDGIENFIKNQKKDQENLLRFQHVFEKIVPCSVLIFKRGKIVFYNHETRSILGVNVEAKIEDKLKNIILSQMKSEVQGKGQKKMKGKQALSQTLNWVIHIVFMNF
jgi:hypothetical protein